MNTKPILHNWVVINGSHGSVIFGEVYQDERFTAGEVVRSSRIVDIDYNCGTVKTENSFYDLGKAAD